MTGDHAPPGGDGTVHLAIDDRIATLTLDRPHKKNALTLAMYTQLADHLQAAERDDDVRVIVVRGEGDAFTAGNDLADFRDDPPDSIDGPTFRLLQVVSTATKPVIAAVHGAAIGIGTTLLLHCDFAYAASGTVFALPFVSLGLCPEGASTLLLPQLLGHRRAAELLLLGERFDAVRACEAGIVNAVVPPSDLLDTAWRTAERLVGLPAASIRATKRLMKQGQVDVIAQTLRGEAELFFERLRSPEAKEALDAFFERRKPDFSRFR